MENSITITVTESVEKEISLKLPVFKKSAASFFKVYSQENCIWVMKEQIQVAHAGLAFHGTGVEDSTEEEFLEACRDTMTHLEELALGM